MNLSFESCALRFLDQWFLQERRYFEELQRSSFLNRLEAIQGAAKYFGIARNFPKKFDIERKPHPLRRLELVLDALDHANDPKINPVEAVEELETLLSTHYGGRTFTSAASKLLWLKHRSGVVIYDRKARESLGLKTENYRDFYAEWEKCYALNRQAIRNACEALPAVRNFSLCGLSIDANVIKHDCSQRWFRERVLDTYLWYRSD